MILTTPPTGSVSSNSPLFLSQHEEGEHEGWDLEGSVLPHDDQALAVETLFPSSNNPETAATVVVSTLSPAPAA